MLTPTGYIDGYPEAGEGLEKEKIEVGNCRFHLAESVSKVLMSRPQ
jgi:hypothetical protein